MRIKLLFLIFFSPLFIKGQAIKYDYAGEYYEDAIKPFHLPSQFLVLDDTLSVVDSITMTYKKVLIIQDSALTDLAGKIIWKMYGNSLINISKESYDFYHNYYRVVNSYMIEKYGEPGASNQYYFMHDKDFMGHVGPTFRDGIYISSATAAHYPPLKQKMQRLSILIYQAELVNAKPK